jgi:hypothetical protein
MSDAPGIRIRGTLLMLAVLPLAGLTVRTPAGAQQTEEELVRHLRELMPRLDSARAEANTARAEANARNARPHVRSVDTLTVGPLRILTPSDERRVAESFFRDVWESEYAPFVDTSPNLERTTFTFQWAADPGTIPVDGPVRRVELLAWRRATSVRTTVVGAIDMALGDDLPDPIREWAGTTVRDRPEAAADVFREMTVAPSRSNRACLAGRAEACWTSLGLDLDATPFDDWYDPEERRAFVAAFGPRRREASTWEACVQARSTAACDLYLMQGFRLPPISNRAARVAALRLALRGGGEGAWDRLRADTSATPADMLRHASGLTSQELATRWRTWMMEGAPRTRAVLDPHLLAYLIWIVAFAALATRSTRWRLR